MERLYYRSDIMKNKSNQRRAEFLLAELAGIRFIFVLNGLRAVKEEVPSIKKCIEMEYLTEELRDALNEFMKVENAQRLEDAIFHVDKSLSMLKILEGKYRLEE